MLLKCEIQVNNRLIPPQDLRGPTRCCRGAVGLYKKCGNEHENKNKSYNIVVYTNRSKSGDKYRIRENIINVFSRFMDNGRATISFKEPQHDICISKADPHDLKRLVHGIKLGFKGEDVPLSSTTQQTSSQNVLKETKLEMKVLTRRNYPLTKSFPSSLVKLSVNGCQMQRFDCRISKLVNLVVLNLSENNLKDLPESLDSLVNLKELHLSKNKFMHVPPCLFNPVLKLNLRFLDMSSNALEMLPIQLCLLDNLTNLRLDDNKISALPYNIGMLKSLRYLSIAQNNISLLPYGFCMLKIDSLDLSRNPLGLHSPCSVIAMNLLAVPSLFEKAARIIVEKSIPYSLTTLPQVLSRYLKMAKTCLCGKVCFESHAVYIMMLDLGKIAHTITADIIDAGRMSAPAEGYLCSLRCYNKWLHNPNSIWK